VTVLDNFTHQDTVFIENLRFSMRLSHNVVQQIVFQLFVLSSLFILLKARSYTSFFFFPGRSQFILLWPRSSVRFFFE